MIDAKLYLITDRTLCSPVPLEAVVAEACAAGVRAVQLREKDLPAGDLHEQARVLRGVTRRAGARLFVNDRADIALAVGADGVHCPERGLPVEAVRTIFPGAVVGASTHSREAVREAEARGAAYVLFGPVFQTPSKARYGAPQGLDALSRVAGDAGIPVFAVGGISPANATLCLERGAAGVAVISAILSSGNVSETVRAFGDALGGL